MLEEYEAWEDSIRRTFIELANFHMKQHSDPIEFAIEFAWANGCDLFVINNAKDELKKLRERLIDLDREVVKSHRSETEELNLYLDTAKDLGDIQKSLDSPVAWAKINDRGDLYDLRLQNNPYNDQSKIVPLYRINK